MLLRPEIFHSLYFEGYQSVNKHSNENLLQSDMETRTALSAKVSPECKLGYIVGAICVWTLWMSLSWPIFPFARLWLMYTSSLWDPATRADVAREYPLLTLHASFHSSSHNFFEKKKRLKAKSSSERHKPSRMIASGCVLVLFSTDFSYSRISRVALAWI